MAGAVTRARASTATGDGDRATSRRLRVPRAGPRNRRGGPDQVPGKQVHARGVHLTVCRRSRMSRLSDGASAGARVDPLGRGHLVSSDPNEEPSCHARASVPLALGSIRIACIRGETARML